MRMTAVAFLCGGCSSLATAQPVLDGVRDAMYGSPRVVQTVQTGFGDANPDGGSELDAAYACVRGGTLYLMLTGNLQSDATKLNIFIDSTIGGQNTIGPSPEVGGWAASYAGFTFDTGFLADFLLIVSNIPGRFDIEFVDLRNGSAGAVELGHDVFGGALIGSNADALPINGIGVAHDRSNTGGVTSGTGAADASVAASVSTGIELRIPLAAIGSPSGPFRISAMINVSGQAYLSNQFLGGLVAPIGNLGGNGTGGFTGDVGDIDLNLFGGSQFFYVPCAGELTDDSIVNVDDLNLVLSNWNTASPQGDTNHDGIVDVDDLNVILSNWACSTPTP